MVFNSVKKREREKKKQLLPGTFSNAPPESEGLVPSPTVVLWSELPAGKMKKWPRVAGVSLTAGAAHFLIASLLSSSSDEPGRSGPAAHRDVGDSGDNDSNEMKRFVCRERASVQSQFSPSSVPVLPVFVQLPAENKKEKKSMKNSSPLFSSNFGFTGYTFFFCLPVSPLNATPTSPDVSILDRAIWTSSSVMSRSKSFSQSSLTSVLEPEGRRHCHQVVRGVNYRRHFKCN